MTAMIRCAWCDTSHPAISVETHQGVNCASNVYRWPRDEHGIRAGTWVLHCHYGSALDTDLYVLTSSDEEPAAAVCDDCICGAVEDGTLVRTEIGETLLKAALDRMFPACAVEDETIDWRGRALAAEARLRELLSPTPRDPATCGHLCTSMWVDGRAQCFECGASLRAPSLLDDLIAKLEAKPDAVHPAELSPSLVEALCTDADE